MGCISKETRLKVLERDGWVCQLCNRNIEDYLDYTVDHIIPIAKGGGNQIENLQATHRFCNELKADGEFDIDAFIEAKPLLPAIQSGGYSIGDLIALKQIKL